MMIGIEQTINNILVLLASSSSAWVSSESIEVVVYVDAYVDEGGVEGLEGSDERGVVVDSGPGEVVSFRLARFLL